MESKKYGIELVKKVIKFLYDTVDEGIDALKDKKISLQEIIGFGDNVYNGISIALKSQELWVEIKDIDTEEGAELAEYVGSIIKDATSDQVDIVIDNSIQIIQKEISIYHENIAPIIEVLKKK